MIRKIITIDEEKCNGCGQCVPNCPEGALQVVDGKARLVGELLCDGLGACVGNCPEGAMTVEERECEAYEEAKVMENILAAGPETLKAHLKHLKDHNQVEYYDQAIAILQQKGIDIPVDAPVKSACGCPGMAAQQFKKSGSGCPGSKSESSEPVSGISELQQWPIQLHLLSPDAPYFDDCDLLIAADCVPFACGKFHQDYLKGKILAMFCPKLDDGLDEYTAKLVEIFQKHTIKSITIVHMQVPCCLGVNGIVDLALSKSGKQIPRNEITISLQGEEL